MIDPISELRVRADTFRMVGQEELARGVEVAITVLEKHGIRGPAAPVPPATNANRRYTDEEDQVIRTMWDRGDDIGAIAAACGREWGAIYKRAVTILRLKPRHGDRSTPPHALPLLKDTHHG